MFLFFGKEKIDNGLIVWFFWLLVFLSSKELSFENIYKLVLEIKTEILNKLSKVLIEC